MSKEDLVSTLEDLIEITQDGIRGFKACAEKTEAEQLKAIFSRSAERCEQGLNELNHALKAYGGAPEEASGTLLGDLHRGLLDLKSAFSSNDDKAILQECERGEYAALDSYRNALEKDLPADVRALIEKQLAGVKSNHDQMKALRDQLS